MISSFTKQLKSAAIFGALLVGSNAVAQLGLQWSEMGPNDLGGRCRSIIIDNTNPTGNTLYAAGVSGGVFKSTNAGQTWAPVNDQAPSLIVSCMAQGANGDIYFGTGESFGRGIDGAGSSGFMGTGLYKITASTSNISQLQTQTMFGNINEVAVAGPTVYVAADYGFFISTDGGASFVEEFTSATNTVLPSAHDVKIGKNGDVYYSSYYTITTGPNTNGYSNVHYCASGQNTFTTVTPAAVTSMTTRGRIEIAPSPVNADYVYMAVAQYLGNLGAVLVSTDKGLNWTTITIGTSQFNPYIGGGNYANCIVADSKKADACFVGSYLLYRWDQIVGNPLGQGDWHMIGQPFFSGFQTYLHNYVHDIKFMPSNLDFFYVASDGGIAKVSGYAPPSLGIEYTPFIAANNGFNVAQFYSVTYSSYPRTNTITSQPNALAPYAGVAGGAIGGGLTYLPGYFTNGPQTSISSSVEDGFQSDFSKLIPKAVFHTGAFGELFRTNDADITPPSNYYSVSYSTAGPSAPGTFSFSLENTPGRLWENYSTKDSSIFYNEIITTFFKNSDKTKKTFSTVNARPQMVAQYDTIIIKATSTKSLSPPAPQTIKIMPVYSGTNISSLNVSGDTPGATSNTVYLSPLMNDKILDSVKYTFTTAPNDSSTINITIKMKYNAGDVISVKNTDISGQFFTSTVTLLAPLATSTVAGAAIVKVPLGKSARYAVGLRGKTYGGVPTVYATKRPLNFAINPDWVKLAGPNSRIDGPGGVASTVQLSPAIQGTTGVTHLEWSPSGKYIYFSTKQSTSSYFVYRVSHLEFLGDSAGDDYSGQFTSDIDSGSVQRKSAKIRTTPLGMFMDPVTSIAVADNDSMLLITTGGYNNLNGTVYYSNGHAGKLSSNTVDATNFSVKNGSTLPLNPTYTGMFEMNDNRVVLVGTESGVYSTNDITAATPVWVKEPGTTNNFPNVPVFQIRQQKAPSWQCYNSGMIYVATHGRGIWSTDKYLEEYAIGIEEVNAKDNYSNLKIYPNPAGNSTNLWFKAAGDANYRITVYDINGRTLIQQTSAKLMEGEHLINLNTADLTSGIYFVSINGTNGFNGNSKLVITH